MMVLKQVLNKSLWILGVVAVLISCKEKKEATEESVQEDSVEYALEIEKSNCTDNQKDIAVLLFEDGFNGDLVDVYLNGNKIFSEKIHTDNSLSFAEDVELGKLSEIANLTISINNSKKMNILNKTCSFTFVNFMDDKVIVKYDDIFVPYN
ncbi:hypothetical protein [Flagellimonas beolgyonensis]|uniref:hypothetical protein n=1 Tax=Flagellimonas beolgyonensis TaxID=864064 RepID=UPI003D64DDA2